MTCCILCLEKETNNDIIFIKILSNVKNIILQHFRIKNFQFNKNGPVQYICPSCLNCVKEFHEFYIRIENAHKKLEEKLVEIPKSNDAAPIVCETLMRTRKRTELERKATEKPNVDLVIAKRGRGRPKSLKKIDVLEETPIDEDACEMFMEADLNGDDLVMDILSVDFKPEIEVSSPLNKVLNNDAIKEIQLLPKKKDLKPTLEKRKTSRATKRNEKKESGDVLIKSELEFEKFVDSQFDNQLASAIDEAHDSDKQVSTVDMKKNYSERRDLSLKFDLFIAENMKLSCCLCELPLENFSQLKAHFRAEHKIRGYVLCCGKKLLKRGVLVDHLHTHRDAEYFKCRECNKVMADRRCLETHMKIHLDKGKPAYRCEICSKSYHRRVVYVRHMQNHMPEEMKKHPCPECSKKFATHYLMNQHLHIVHLNTYSKICDICGKKIHGRDALQRHQQQHHDSEPPPPIQCELCGLTLTTKYGLNRHMKAKHIADYQKPQICPYCSKVSPSFFAQKRHIYYMHNIERRHSCPMCDKAFKRSKDLREHMTTHTGDVLYSCPYCPKTFNSDANMYAHRKRVHRKEWEQKMKEKFPLVNVIGETYNAELHQPMIT